MSAGGPVAVAFPGQGVDPVDLVRILRAHADDPLARLLAQRTGRSSWAPDAFADTRVAQPAVYVAGLLQAAAIGPVPGDAVAAVGHSLGELTALAWAGALDPAAGLDLVLRRADLGHEQHRARPGRMVAVLKLDPPDLEWVRRSATAATGGVLEVAADNGPRQVVLSGDAAAADRAAELATAAGGVARPLAIGGAYHSPLLAGAVAPFAAAVAAARPTAPLVPVVSATAGVVLDGPDGLPDVLGRALVVPVRWGAALGLLQALGVRSLVDAGPGTTLANLAKHLPVLPVTPLSPARRPAAADR